MIQHPHLQTMLVHVPVMFFLAGFVLKTLSLFTVKCYLDEAAIFLLVLATAGIVTGYLHENSSEIESELHLFGRTWLRSEMVQLMVGMAVFTSVLYIGIHVSNLNNYWLKIPMLCCYLLLMVIVFSVAKADKETFVSYGNEISSALPKFIP